MAFIGRIRKNSWLMVILIGLGLFGFIVMDMMSGQQSVFGSQSNVMGEVGNQKLDPSEFNRTESIMRDFLYQGSNIDPYILKDQVWNYLVESKIVGKEAESLGLGVSRDELLDLQFGANPSPLIQQRFRNQQTQQLDRGQLDQIKAQIESGEMQENFKVFWAHQEKEIVNQRLKDKLSNMAAKAVYTPNWMVESMNQDINGSMNLEYVFVPYADVDNTDIALTDTDFQSYYNENSFRYKQDEQTRKVEYVTFDVVPSAGDSADIRKILSDKVVPFQNGNDSLFVESNYGTISPGFFKVDELPEGLKAIAGNAAAGTVLGPYVDGNEYRLTKIIERVSMADSADTRHILISAADANGFVAAEAKVDSLKRVIESGAAKFADMATQFSQDPGSKDKGGKYESVTPNQFVPEYNEILFVTGQIGRLYKVRTSYGVHLVEVLSRDRNSTDRVKVGTFGQAIIPSESTTKAVVGRVSSLVSKNETLNELKTALKDDPKVSFEVSPAFKRNDYLLGTLGQGQGSRDIIRWAFGDDINSGMPDVGEIAPEFYSFSDPVLGYHNKYVLAGLSSVIPEGTPTWQQMRTEIEPYVINRKKAELLKGKLNGQDLNAMAANNGVVVETANAVRFSGASGALSNEPQVISAAASLQANGVSQPIAGNSGVYVVKKTSQNAAPAANAMAIKPQAENSYKGRLTTGLFGALKKAIGVEDNRSTFF